MGCPSLISTILDDDDSPPRRGSGENCIRRAKNEIAGRTAPCNSLHTSRFRNCKLFRLGPRKGRGRASRKTLAYGGVPRHPSAHECSWAPSRKAMMITRVMIVTPRYDRELRQLMERAVAGEPTVSVIEDRRIGQRRKRVTMRTGSDRRKGDRRRRERIDTG